MGGNKQTPTAMIRMLACTTLLPATVFTMGATQAAKRFKMNTAAKTTMERALHRQLSKHLSFSVLERGHNMTSEVAISFVVNNEGRIEVLNATSTNEDLRAYVLRKLNKVDIGSNPEGVPRTSHLRFVFRPEVWSRTPVLIMQGSLGVPGLSAARTDL